MALPRTMVAVLSFAIPLACSAVEIQSGTLHATADEFGYVTQYSLDGGVTNELWQLYGYIGNEYGVIPTAPGNSYSQFFDVDSFNTTATGITSSLRLNALGAAELGLQLRFEGSGVDEHAIVDSIAGDAAPALQVGDVIVRVDPRYFRPAEVETLLGDPTKARDKLGWVPEITVEQMCAEMVREDLKVARRNAFLKANGHEISLSVEN